VSNFWVVNSRYGLLNRLVVNNVPAAATVTVTCSGKGCPFKSRRFTPDSRGEAVATKEFAKRRLRLGAVLENGSAPNAPSARICPLSRARNRTICSLIGNPGRIIIRVSGVRVPPPA
jgi:hypothetical protein